MIIKACFNAAARTILKHPYLSKTICFFLFTFTVNAQFSDLNFGAGLMNQSIGKLQRDTSGSRSAFNHRLTLEAGLEYELSDDFFLAADLGALWPGGADEEYITKRVFYSNLHGGYKFSEDFSLRLGGGMTFTHISGEGGTVDLRNGTGTTSFIIPDQSSTARNITFNIAGLYHFDPDYSVKLETFVFNLITSRNRTFNYALTVRYHFGDSLWRD